MLEDLVTTNPILTALHLHGLKSNIYVHFQSVHKQLSGFHSGNETINEACNQLGGQKHYKIFINIEVIIFVTYHLKVSLSF